MKIFFAIFIVASMTLASFSVSVIIQEFCASTTITTIESVNQNLDSLETFPSIIICNQNKVCLV